MRRRAYLAALAALGVAGCSSDRPAGTDGTTTATETRRSVTIQQAGSEETTVAGALPSGYDVETVKQNAEAVDYDTLFRNIESYEGEPVYYRYAEVYQTIYDDSYDYLQMNVSTTAEEWQGDVAAYWLGEGRLLEDDYMQLWAVVGGLHEYETVQGNTRTIPLLLIADYELRDG